MTRRAALVLHHYRTQLLQRLLLASLVRTRGLHHACRVLTTPTHARTGAAAGVGELCHAQMCACVPLCEATAQLRRIRCSPPPSVL